MIVALQQQQQQQQIAIDEPDLQWLYNLSFLQQSSPSRLKGMPWPQEVYERSMAAHILNEIAVHLLKL